jgi:hypothetical protein
MDYVLIIHAVKDYPAWKTVFDEAAGIRKAGGGSELSGIERSSCVAMKFGIHCGGKACQQGERCDVWCFEARDGGGSALGIIKSCNE